MTPRDLGNQHNPCNMKRNRQIFLALQRMMAISKRCDGMLGFGPQVEFSSIARSANELISVNKISSSNSLTTPTHAETIAIFDELDEEDGT